MPGRPRRRVTLSSVRVVHHLALIALATISLTFVSAIAARTMEDGKPKLAITKGAQAWANRINLKLGDFGPGWRAEPDTGGDSSSKCFARDLSRLTLNGRASSPDFLHGNLPYAASLAAIFATAPQARTAFIALRAALDDCLVREIDKESQFEDSTGGPLNFPHLGERSFAFQVATHAKEGKLSLAVYFDVVVIQRARAVALGAFADAITPFDENLERKLARAIAQRMKPRA
jgi:hypothetical protein